MQWKYSTGALASIIALGALSMAHGRAEEAKPQAGTNVSGEAKTQIALPVVEGHPFVEPINRLPRPNTRESEKIMEVLTTSASIERGAKPEVKPGLPAADKAPRERGESIAPAVVPSYYYRGLGEIFQYTNDGAPDRSKACGQAAIATILTYYRIKPRDTGSAVINEIYRRYPPDIAWGILGTSWQQMTRALSGYGVPYNWYSGEAGLKNALNLYKPCIVMLDVGAIPGEGWGWGGHWVVAYGYDKYYIYFTNWNPDSRGNFDGGRCTWINFRKAWLEGQLSKANGTANLFICPRG